MPKNQSESIVLRTFHVADHDKIAVCLSKEKGLLKGIAKGARKFGSRFGSALEPMSHVNVFYYEKEGKELVTISNCDLIESFFEIQKDPRTAFSVSYCSELIESSLPSRSENDVLFRLLLSTLKALKSGGNLGFLIAYFEAWFLKISGFMAHFQKCKKCQKAIDTPAWLSAQKDGAYCSRCAIEKKETLPSEINPFIAWVTKNPPPQGKNLPFRTDQVQAVSALLKKVLIFHLERTPKSLALLQMK